LSKIWKGIDESFPEKIKDKCQELDQMLELYKNTRLEFFMEPYCKALKNRGFMDKVQLKLPGLHNYIYLFDDKDKYFF